MITLLSILIDNLLQDKNYNIEISDSSCDELQCNFTYSVNEESFSSEFVIEPTVTINFDYNQIQILEKVLHFDPQFKPELQSVDGGYLIESENELFISKKSEFVCLEDFGGYCQEINTASAISLTPLMFNTPIQLTCLGCRVFEYNAKNAEKKEDFTFKNYFLKSTLILLSTEVAIAIIYLVIYVKKK